MDYFKIFTLIFMIFITYKLYFNESKLEGFEGTQQSLGGVDDTNAINTLAQIAKNLMAGGVTVPGNITIQGNLTSSGEIKFGGDNANGFRWDNEGGNGWACLRGLNGGDNSFCMHNSHGNGTRLHPGGSVTVKGRDILAEIDDIKRNYVKYDSIVSNQRVHDGAFVWGDGRGNPDSVWSNWYIHRDNGMR